LSDNRPSPSFLGSAYTGRVCLASDLESLYLAYRYAGRIDHLAPHGGLKAPVLVPFRWQPYVSADTLNPTMITFGTSRPLARRAYTDCSVTDRFMYAAYSGRLQGRPRNPYPPSEVHVFDSSGKLDRIIVLDHFAMTFAVQSDDRALYSVSEDADGFVVRVTQLHR